MLVSRDIIQTPPPGEKICRFSGDRVKFELRIPEGISGDAYIRTNLGHVKVMRREIIRQVERGEVKFHMDWYDIKMKKKEENTYEIVLPLCEVGHFEAKCYVLSENENAPVWPEGENVYINVKPAHSCAGNTIYNAFVRLFGPSKHSVSWMEKFDLTPLDKAGFNVIPPSGTFRDLIKELDFIIYELGCTYIQLLPIFPVPTTFGRMGRFGSPYAVQDFFSVEPQLAQFDPKKTPMEQFVELANEIHKRGAYLILDIPINHTGWGSMIHDLHPEWLKRTKKGEIEVPEVWGVKWEDLTKLDYSKKELWKYMAEVFLKWCDRGVDGFRGDAGYMLPLEVWEYIIAKVRESFPDTIFFLEGLGGDINITRNFLTHCYDWAYSELFQNYTREQIVPYVKFATEVSKKEGIMIHFCETHDNNRLASVSREYAKMRTGLCALLSYCGGFGFACGVEWFATEKINVHEITSLNWGSAHNQVKFIKRLTSILKSHPLFYSEADIDFPEVRGDNFVVAIRKEILKDNYLIIAVNLNCNRENQAFFTCDLEIKDKYYDLITGREIFIQKQGDFLKLDLKPAQVLCLSPLKEDLLLVDDVYFNNKVVPKVCVKQRAREKLYKFFNFLNGFDHMDIDGDILVDSLLRDPFKFLKDYLSPEHMVIKWNYPEDIKRMVMVPPKAVILFTNKFPFKIKLKHNKKTIYVDKSIKDHKGNHFILLCPDIKIKYHTIVELFIYVYEDEVVEQKSSLLFLMNFENEKIKTSFTRREILKNNLVYLASNKRGALSYVPVWWGYLDTKYNSLLSANLNPDYLDDRFVMFTRLRAWVVHQGYSEEISKDLIQKFSFDYENNARWDFYVPTGIGKHIHLTIFLHLVEDKNGVIIKFLRHDTKKEKGDGKEDLILSENEETDQIELILRPDIEARSHHELTKAYMGPENKFPSSIKTIDGLRGFLFCPEENVRLKMEVTKGDFVSEPEWKYMVHLPLEEQRGLEPLNDLFSPGYFKVSLGPGEEVILSASVNEDILDFKEQFQIKETLIFYQNELSAMGLRPLEPPEIRNNKNKSTENQKEALINQSFLKRDYLYLEGLKAAMDKFLVRSKIDEGSYVYTLVAGFPWFLDWGRDSLIFSRAYVEDGRFDKAISILKYFGRYEENGTLPNLIKGNVPLNRDTSDAPLWFGVVLHDLVEKMGEGVLMEKVYRDRSFEDVLLSIGCNYIKGTPNGIKVDLETGLVFSPAHFTWMDTNYPACTPRQGYPIEIQALWYRIICLLEKIDPDGDKCPAEEGWTEIKEKVKDNVIKLYFHTEKGYLADCLHLESFAPALYAQKDDHLRPNQLLCITLEVIEDSEIMEKIVDVTSSLLVPGGIRSLADRTFKFPLYSIPESAIPNPYHPYIGEYLGDEDNKRKPAYHNGTAWTWLFPSYVEALFSVQKLRAQDLGLNSKVDLIVNKCLSLLSSCSLLLHSGCVGHIPEIMDGNLPHTQRGCYAQGWGVSELYRVMKKLITYRSL